MPGRISYYAFRSDLNFNGLGLSFFLHAYASVGGELSYTHTKEMDITTQNFTATGKNA